MATTGTHSVIYPVKDLAAVKAVYTKLFGEPHTDTPYYVGYNTGGQEIGLNPQGHAQGLTDGTVYWDVADIKTAVQDLLDAGATVRQEPQEVGGGTVIATLSDAGGNTIGLISRS